ncbi:uncharacterized protein [Anas acuta]|uniref:uncharacterized protein isoform X1 n=1 Tax=Anas acuta TaxID=28680 RepID=UPI0035C88192
MLSCDKKKQTLGARFHARSCSSHQSPSPLPAVPCSTPPSCTQCPQLLMARAAQLWERSCSPVLSSLCCPAFEADILDLAFAHCDSAASGNQRSQLLDRLHHGGAVWHCGCKDTLLPGKDFHISRGSCFTLHMPRTSIISRRKLWSGQNQTTISSINMQRRQGWRQEEFLTRCKIVLKVMDAIFAISGPSVDNPLNEGGDHPRKPPKVKLTLLIDPKFQSKCMKKKEDNLLHSLATRQNSVPNAQLKITSLNRFNPKQTSMVLLHLETGNTTTDMPALVPAC